LVLCLLLSFPLFQLEPKVLALANMLLKPHEAVFKAGAQRVITTIKIDDRRDKKETMEYKVKAVKEKM